MNDFIIALTKHHINPKYILTPLSVVFYRLDNGGLIECIYIFGIRLIRKSIIE